MEETGSSSSSGEARPTFDKPTKMMSHASGEAPQPQQPHPASSTAPFDAENSSFREGQGGHRGDSGPDEGSRETSNSENLEDSSRPRKDLEIGAEQSELAPAEAEEPKIEGSSFGQAENEGQSKNSQTTPSSEEPATPDHNFLALENESSLKKVTTNDDDSTKENTSNLAPSQKTAALNSNDEEAAACSSNFESEAEASQGGLGVDTDLKERGDVAPAPIQSISPGRSQKQKINPSEYIHQIKWISWHSTKTPIITQNDNGPCPLLAVMNVLLLRGQVVLPDGIEFITAQNLLERLGDCILRLIPSEFVQRPDYQQNVSDALLVLPKLITGLDVNVKFTGVSEFEFTPELIVFDLLNICLYHGWIIDNSNPQNLELLSAVGSFSYNQLVERIIENKHCGDSLKLSEAICAEEFLENSASQLTNFGIEKLREQMKADELAVFFRNNHFATILKHENNLLFLVTDQGFLNEHDVIWETLNDVGGDSIFLNAEFHTVPPKSEQNGNVSQSLESTDRQMDHDLMIAMSLMQEEGERGSANLADCEELDRQIAIQLQQEEENKMRAAEGRTREEASGSTAARGSEPSQSHSPDSNKKKKDKDKCLVI